MIVDVHPLMGVIRRPGCFPVGRLSLWEMISQVYAALHVQVEHIEFLGALADHIGPSPERKVQLVADCRAALTGLRKECDRFDLIQSRKFIHEFIQDIDADTDNSAIAHEIRTIVKLIKQEAGDRFVFVIKASKSTYTFNALERWMPIVTADKFPSAAKDVLSALRCYEYEENTACVFHVMRVAEYGLRALARERKITLPRGKHIEWQTWQTIISQIEASVKPLGSLPAGPKKDAMLSFYSGALGQFYAFKDQYRNVVMHARESYDEIQALSALSHVLDFMDVLSQKIDEKTKRPIRKWP